MWNSLPNDLRKVEDFKEFRRLVGSSFKCSKVNQFYFCLCLCFSSVCFIPALLCLTFILILFSVCFAFTKFLVLLELLFKYARLVLKTYFSFILILK